LWGNLGLSQERTNACHGSRTQQAWDMGVLKECLPGGRPKGACQGLSARRVEDRDESYVATS
jgi:hypothetical protein